MLDLRLTRSYGGQVWIKVWILLDLRLTGSSISSTGYMTTAAAANHLHGGSVGMSYLRCFHAG